jgi:hypothetical protein
MVGKLNRIEVRAHCQRKPLTAGSAFQNRWDLCYARGRVVQRELESRGIDGQRIRLSQSEANEPLAANLTEEELRLNSRVDVILLDDLVAAPWQRTPHADDTSHAPSSAPGVYPAPAESHGTGSTGAGSDASHDSGVTPPPAAPHDDEGDRGAHSGSSDHPDDGADEHGAHAGH